MPHVLGKRGRIGKAGNITIWAALCAPLIIYALGLGVDIGSLTLQQRKLQQVADISAIVAASDISNAERNLADHFRANGMNLAVKTDNGLMSPDGLYTIKTIDQKTDFSGIASLTKGTYTPDATLSIDKRFAAGANPADAVKVSIVQSSDLYFAKVFATAPTLHAVGTASAQKLAAFSIGSRLASLNSGILNSLLGGLLGTNISLSVMDYNDLLNADVNALSVVDGLAMDIHLTGLSYSELLDTEITYPQLLHAIGKQSSLPLAAQRIVASLEKTLATSNVKLDLADVLNLDPYDNRLIGSGSYLSAEVDVFQLISAAAVAANGGKQLSIALPASVPGIAAMKLTVAVGEPPQHTPSVAVGAPGTIVRTAQTRIALEVSIKGLAAIAGLQIRLPLYIEIADAEAKLKDIQCLASTPANAPANANVGIDAVPGVAELSIGDVDTSAFDNFSSDPRVKKTKIIDSVLLNVSAIAHVDIDNMSPSRLTFTPADIAANRIKTVSTKDTLTSAVSSLLKNLDLDINILFLTIGTPTAVQAALADSLAAIAPPLDTVLYNILATLGVKIGEADVRVTDAQCRQSVLVQ